jgi:quinoprotein glucose dehydrogenase
MFSMFSMFSMINIVSLVLIQIWSFVVIPSTGIDEDPPPPSSAKVPDGFSAEVIATEPQIQDAVAFWIDPDGRLLVAETERTNHGAMDNRSSPWQLEDDLQSLTVEDRIAFMEKWKDKRANGMDFYTEKPDRVRRSIDADGDGIYDTSTIFAGPFNDVPDGIGAGVMTVGDEVWYTNIPNLWRLKDADGDGIAEVRESIQSGFGVRFALYGHDMHGLALGPDGRVYWSIGDRG